ncbi:hypothetical protein [Alkalicoccus halolimnae]|uniref:SinR family protein n=1 Tax=Alkalicoccus halolimnae TaxID=1667239 RepID=A0A5C7F6Q4_9BACI|nr:hypothetical protein [Alkalicoccus halolimnae]TXF86401.1 hypothetical protein FTX54_03990 [Alkalicoccus halolimnae]
MAVYVVTYQLSAPEKEYKQLHETMKSFGNYSKRFESFWLIDTFHSAKDVKEKVFACLSADDQLFVIETKKHWSSRNVPDGMIKWLKSDRRKF